MSIFSGIGDILGGITGAIGDVLEPIGSIIGPAISGVSGYLGQGQANQQNLAIARETNAFNASQAQGNRAWMYDMSTTAYQRAVQDMRLAGLNPMLAYSQGGAPTPASGAASGVTATMLNKATAATSAAAAAATVQNQMADVDLKQSQAEVNRATLPKIAQETARISAETGLTEAKVKKVADEIQALRAQANKDDLQALESRTRSELNRWDFYYNKPEELAILKARAELLNLDIPEQMNRAVNQNKYKFYWQNIGPFIPDVKRGVGSAAQAIPLLRR